MKKKSSTAKKVTIENVEKAVAKVSKRKVKVDKPEVTEKKIESSIIQSLLGDIAFAVKGTTHSSIITTLTKCHKDILNIKKDVGIAN